MLEIEGAHVVNEFGKERKNCLCVVSWRDTIRVANRSRVSCGEEGE